VLNEERKKETKVMKRRCEEGKKGRSIFISRGY
jgi:hypothetical protein